MRVRIREGGPSEIAIVFCRLRSIVNDSLSADRTFSMTSGPHQDTAAFYNTAVYNTKNTPCEKPLIFIIISQSDTSERTDDVGLDETHLHTC